MTTTHILCCVCCKMNARLCKGCGHVAYCTVACQKIHWPIHKEICSPAVSCDKRKAIATQKAMENEWHAKREGVGVGAGAGGDDTTAPPTTIKKAVDPSAYNGKIVAVRNIKKAEIVAAVQPVMIASNDRGILHPPDSILCLTCSKWFQNSRGYRCSSCKWPVCSPECEKGYLHAEYECKVFSKIKLMPPRQPNQFYDDTVLALRCLLLKKIDPPKFTELFEWKDVCRRRLKPKDWTEWDRRIKNYLIKDCQLLLFVDINEKEILSYLRVIDSCALTLKDRVKIYSSDYGNSNLCAKYVFPMKFLITEECSPNTKWSIKHSSSLSECTLRLHATSIIPQGSYISACFTCVNDYGATFPYRYQNLRFDTPCLCRRCLDPSELGSFFSGVRCQECDPLTPDGYLLPKNPQKTELGWRCIKCRTEVPGDTIRGVIEDIYREMCGAGNDFYFMLHLMYKYKTTLHPNHYLFLMSSTICVDLFWGSVRGLPFFSPRYDFFIATINLANTAVRILSASCPGATLPRARILFQLQVAYAYKHLREFRRYMEWGENQEGKCCPKLFWELLKIQEEAFDILATEPYGSVEHELSLVLMEVIEDSIDLLCHHPRDVPMDSIAIYNLHKIYTRFSNEYYYPAIPIYEDKDIYEFIVCSGSSAKHLADKNNI